MRILMLTASKDPTDGWGRYATGFIEEAERRGHEVISPEPETLPSLRMRWRQPLDVFFDSFRILGEAKGCDLIHSLTEPSAPLAAWLSFLSRKPYLLSVIGTYSVLKVFPRQTRWMYRAAYRGADGVAILSSYTASVVGKNYPSDLRSIVPGGFDGEVDSTPRESPGRPWRILSVGALKPRKGFHTLIPALGILKEGGADFRCDIVGTLANKEYVERIEALISEHGLDGRVALKGKVSEDDLERSYRDSDLFVLPSEHIENDFEGLGLVYLEAMARGLPAVGCLNSGAIDIIKEGKNGRLVPEKDPEALSHAIVETLKDPSRYRAMSAEALATAPHFRWNEVGRGMDELQRACAEKKKP